MSTLFFKPAYTLRKQSFLLFILVFTFCTLSKAQQAATSTGSEPLPSETTVDSLFVFQDTTAKEEKPKPTVGSILSQVINKAQVHAITLSDLKMELSEFIDTTEMSAELPGIYLLAQQVRDKVQEDSHRLNLRYLKGMDNLISIVSEENEKFRKNLQQHVQRLSEVGQKLHEIKSDTVFTFSLRDTTILPEMTNELAILKTNLYQVDSLYLAQEIATARFQSRVSENTVLFMDLKQFLSQTNDRLEKQYWTKEINYPWESSTYTKEPNLLKELGDSIVLNLEILRLYITRNSVALFIYLILTVLVYSKLKSVIKNISRKKEFASLILDRIQYFRKHTLVSTIMIALPFILLVSTSPPLAYISILSMIMVAAATFLIQGQFDRQFFKLWAIFLPIYLIFALSSLNWLVIFKERWFVLIMSALFILLGIKMLKLAKTKSYEGAKVLEYLSYFLIAFQVFAFLANIFGRFNLAKTYAVTGSIMFYRGVCLYLFVHVCLEAIYMLIENSKSEADGFTSYFDFQDLQRRMRGLLLAFSIGAWVYGVVWSLGYYDNLYLAAEEFLTKPRTLGATEFQFGSILLLIIILYVSTFLANNIAYFATMKDQKKAQSRKQRLGSSILIIRLAVLTIGFFIGMTAAKIPLDKIAIVLGALSVGIGFGLQTIINNLVSGIILAFERPIQIGDEIQVGTNSGTVKEVGIRASKIQAYDGSEIVIPNGDLLSQSLINWTLSDKKRRIELFIGVGYTSDMKLVKSVISEALQNDRIMKIPAPRVYMQTFNHDSVDFRVLFWVETIDVWVEVRDEVMTAIFEKFAAHHIEIPFPKRDLYIKSFPSNWKEKISKPGDEVLPKPEEKEDEEKEN